MEKCLKRIFIVIFIVLLCLNIQNKVYASGEQSIESAKNGIVELETGLKTSKGKFYVVKRTCGFVVCNEPNGVYIITTNNSTTITDKEKAKYIKKNKLKESADNLDTSIRIIVEGDVTSEVSILADSKNNDFSIVRSGDVLNEKAALRLGSREDVAIGDKVYALGFSGDSEKRLKYTVEEVEIHAGTVQDAGASLKDVTYIQHSAAIKKEQSGGVLMSENGYVIGMNNASATNKKIDAYYALSIDEIKSVLDNYGIFYESREHDTALQELKSTYDKCEELIKSKKYKNASLTALKEVLQSVETDINNKQLSIAEIKTMKAELDNAKSGLVLKTSKLAILKIVLFIVLIILIIVFIFVYAKYRTVFKKVNGKVIGADDIVNQQGGGDKSPGQALGMEIEKGFRFSETKGRILSEKAGNYVFVNKPEFKIGKNTEEMDMVVSGNKAVSRSHALIRWIDGEYYLFDLNSVNGTYLNGKKISRDGAKLSDKDIISLADEKFKFILEEV